MYTHAVNNLSKSIIVIVGPTATGKSDLAVQLAKKFNGEIISADSRQVYKDLDIGTGKITASEMFGIKHHLLDVCDPKNTYNVTDYVSDAKVAVNEIASKNKLPIIVGGTGFYIQALVDGVILPEVTPDDNLRQELSNKSTLELYSELKNLDPIRANNIDQKNKRRIIRAIEIAKSLGSVPPIQNNPLPYSSIFIGLQLPSEELRSRIRIRLDRRIESGMIEEAEKIHANGLSLDRMNELGLEYRYLAKFLAKEITLEEMFRQLEIQIWRYAKRQLTWFKKDKRIHWIQKPYFDNAIKIIEQHIK